MTASRRTFLKQISVLSLGAGFGSVAFGSDGAAALPRSTPEAEGVDPAGILAFLDAVGHSKHELHSLMMLRHGKVVAEGTPTDIVSKSQDSSLEDVFIKIARTGDIEE